MATSSYPTLNPILRFAMSLPTLPRGRENTFYGTFDPTPTLNYEQMLKTAFAYEPQAAPPSAPPNDDAIHIDGIRRLSLLSSSDSHSCIGSLFGDSSSSESCYSSGWSTSSRSVPTSPSSSLSPVSTAGPTSKLSLSAPEFVPAAMKVQPGKRRSDEGPISRTPGRKAGSGPAPPTGKGSWRMRSYGKEDGGASAGHGRVRGHYSKKNPYPVSSKFSSRGKSNSSAAAPDSLIGVHFGATSCSVSFITPPRAKERAGSCIYCMHIGQPKEIFETHCLRNPVTGRLICPSFNKNNLCHTCGDKAERIHTADKCPHGQQQGSSLLNQLNVKNRQGSGASWGYGGRGRSSRV